MKVNEIRKLKDEEILKKVKETKTELLNLRIKNATASLEKPSKINEMKKDVARMLTVLRERELKSAVEGKNE